MQALCRISRRFGLMGRFYGYFFIQRSAEPRAASDRPFGVIYREEKCAPKKGGPKWGERIPYLIFPPNFGPNPSSQPKVGPNPSYQS